MKIETLSDATAVARRGAELIAAKARAAVQARGLFTLAVSGGQTPWEMLHLLTREDVPWHSVHLFQVDERIAPDGHADRNLNHIAEALLAVVPIRDSQVHAMPVEAADLDAAVRQYAQTLRQVAGSPPVLDLAHLGLGPDGHTASLVPGDAALDVVDADVALTGIYMGRRRMTLTFPMLNRSRCILWLATGDEKRAMVARLRALDATLPAGRIEQRHALLLADRAALG